MAVNERHVRSRNMLGSELVRRDGNTSAAVRPTWRNPSALLAAFLLLSMMVIVGLTTKPAAAAPEPTFVNKAPDGAGFTISPGDLKFILKQIKISEEHVRTMTADNPCGTLVGPGALQIPERRTPWGLRTVDGSCNNLFPGQERFATADEPFPRLTTPRFKPAEGAPAGFVGPGSPAIASSSYAQKKGNVFDSRPRTISNLIVDQTSTNPAAVAAAKFPVRTQGNEGIDACTTDPVLNADGSEASPGVPEGCTPSHKTLFIPNVTTDVGLSPPYNSVFTFFGQFFDHGVDQTVKSGGTVFVPLKADDPLITLGPDGEAGSGDEVLPSQAFMVLTRAQNLPGPDGIAGDHSPNPSSPVACTAATRPNCDGSADDVQNATNTDSPLVDQSQTYTSHSSHQAFLREYVLSPSGRPVDTGHLLGGMPGNGATGMATWQSTKDQALRLLGMRLEDKDVLNIPMIAADPYGNFIPGPARGLPQYVTDTGLVEGNRDAPVSVPANVKYFDTPFLTDIAHNADPSPQDTDHNPATAPVAPTRDEDLVASDDFANQPPGTYDDEMLDAHFIAGDGRVNENIALTAVHQVFHSEHDRLVEYVKGVLTEDAATGDAAAVARLASWKLGARTVPSVGTTTGSAALTAPAGSFEPRDVGRTISGTGIPAGVRIVATRPDGDGATLSEPATLSNVITATLSADPNATADGWDGKRLFQAARFVTEMEYQHLVFEEFARKVQPNLKPFFGYDPDINAAIPAEFAHAVYRFGHSMLDDQLARVDETATGGVKRDNSITLLKGFLNPPEYFKRNNPANTTPYTPEQAAGSIFLGSSDQIGNELDEFVTETLRNNLLGLPLDLPTINMTRAREADVTTLNDLRRQI